MWGLLGAVCVGIFSSIFGSFFGLGSPEEEAARGMTNEPYTASYFDEGFQVNEESNGRTDAALGDVEAPISPETVEKVDLPLVDVSVPKKSLSGEKNAVNNDEVSGATVNVLDGG